MIVAEESAAGVERQACEGESARAIAGLLECKGEVVSCAGDEGVVLAQACEEHLERGFEGGDGGGRIAFVEEEAAKVVVHLGDVGVSGVEVPDTEGEGFAIEGFGVIEPTLRAGEGGEVVERLREFVFGDGALAMGGGLVRGEALGDCAADAKGLVVHFRGGGRIAALLEEKSEVIEACADLGVERRQSCEADVERGAQRRFGIVRSSGKHEQFAEVVQGACGLEGVVAEGSAAGIECDTEVALGFFEIGEGAIGSSEGVVDRGGDKRRVGEFGVDAACRAVKDIKHPDIAATEGPGVCGFEQSFEDGVDGGDGA